MRSFLTDARHHHRRRLRHRRRGHRQRRHEVGREHDQLARHELHHGLPRRGDAERRAHLHRQLDADRRRRRRHQGGMPGRRLRLADRARRGADRGRRAELGNVDSGRQHRLSAHPLMERGAGLVLHRSGREERVESLRPRQHGRRQPLPERRGRRPDRPHQERAVQSRRRPREKGRQHDGPGSGRHRHRARTPPS